MSTILVVDDEHAILEELEFALSRDGHIVMTAANAPDAIEIGSRFRPDVLVVDWMLKDHIHGLDVADVLRVVSERMRVILITGFASSDLEMTANSKQVSGFIRKPFELSDIRSAVLAANRESASGDFENGVPIGVVEVSGEGGILYANRHGRELFAETTAGRGVTNLNELVDSKDQASLANSTQEWKEVSPIGCDGRVWHIRTTEWPDLESRFCVILDESDVCYRISSAVKLLLGVFERRFVEWPVSEHIIVVENDSLYRRKIVSGLHGLGCVCHSAEDVKEALRILEKDESLRVVLLNCDMLGDDASEVLTEMLSGRPFLRILGTGAEESSEELDALIDHYLRKPWTLDDLAILLSVNVGTEFSGESQWKDKGEGRNRVSGSSSQANKVG